MRSITVLSLISFVVCLGACAPAAEEAEEEVTATEADVEAINEVRDEWVAAFKTGDAAASVTAHAEDAMWMPPNEPVLSGKEAIISRNESMFDQYAMEEFSLSSEEVVVAGDWAFDRGTGKYTLTPRGEGEPIEDIPKYVAILKKQPDNSWKYARWIWNSNNPPPGQ